MASFGLSALKSVFAPSDEQTMWRVKMDDDHQAFAALVERWQDAIQRLCIRMLGDVHRAEDLTQEAFAKVFTHRKAYEPTAKFSTFLWRIALNLCYDELRKLKRRGEQSLEDHTDAHGEYADQHQSRGPDTDAVENERAAAVRDALLQLAEPYRVVVVLRHYEGLKFREIADVMNIPEGTVKSRMAEALNQLNLLLNPVIYEDRPRERRNESLVI